MYMPPGTNAKLLTPPLATAILPSSTPSGFQLLFVSIGIIASRLQDLHMDSISDARIHIAHGIGMDAIRKAIIGVREDLSVMQSLAVLGDVETVDRRWLRGVVFARESVDASVCHINMLIVGTDLDAVGSNEIVGYSLHNASLELIAIDLRTDARRRTKVSVVVSVS